MIGDKAIVGRKHLQHLLDALAHRNYELVGPTMRDRAITYESITSVEDLPIGWTESQSPGAYRLEKRGDEAFFGYVVGADSWKKFLHPPVSKLWKAERNGSGFKIQKENDVAPKFAFIGVRSCDLHAISVQDKVFMEGDYIDPTYKSRRDRAFIVAVDCAQSSKTCFCPSLSTGPKATSGFDLSLTEIIGPDSEGFNRHYFEVEVGTEMGADILRDVPLGELREGEASAEQITESTLSTILKNGTGVNIDGIKDKLYRNYEHPRWDVIASRCLTCGNCTMVCPTCFCVSVEDFTDLDGKHAERRRKWDSCFTLDFSYIHGGVVRTTPKARYRHWLIHKFAAWVDQFDALGCVGCGRCITWCPVGINIAEEVGIICEDR
ncbi:MAG: 4Fe-4S dicluster domain-containing protein [Actinobacteria bacterium]|nr:4Fe-4S dicluster domain-containing protein [Actinomycetota bacterium]